MIDIRRNTVLMMLILSASCSQDGRREYRIDELNSNLETLFASMDSNKDGFLTIEEVVDAVPSLHDAEIAKNHARQDFYNADASGDGRISLKEFKQDREKSFRCMDKDNDGVIKSKDIEENAFLCAK